MTATMQNRSAYLARHLRVAARDLSATEGKTDPKSVALRANAMSLIESTAEILEDVALHHEQPTVS